MTELVECFTREANYMARLTIQFIDRTGVFSHEGPIVGPLALPAEFLLELAAILRIGMWERDGIRERIAADLPQSEEAFEELMERAARRPGSFASTIVSPPLHRRVMHIILREFAWNGPRDLGADIVLGRLESVDDDEALDALAEFLWARRHSASRRYQTTPEAARG